MPTYEYRCEQCSHQFEVFARMSDPDPEDCESCGTGTLVKVLFPVAVHYKGSGFYSTDYSGAKETTAATAEAGSSSSSSGESASSKGEASSGSSESSASSPSTGSDGGSKSDA